MRTDDFIKKWDDFRDQNGFMQRLDPSHPLDFFIGINEKGYDHLTLFTEVEPMQMKSSKALEVEKNKRKDGKWATQISSLEKENQSIFARLCLDLVEISYDSPNEQVGLSRVAARFLAWQKLFASLKESLPKSVLKGLVGELFFARFLIEKGYSKDEVIQAWQGPNGSDRDYVLNNQWFEIKAISTGKDKVTISSLNQLETDREGYLVIMDVDDSSKTDNNAVSIADIIREMRTLLLDAPEANRLFEEKLFSIGYLDKTIYEDIYFIIGNKTFYSVKKDFPRLITENVPTEIVSVSYDLSIVGIAPWKVEESVIWN